MDSSTPRRDFLKLAGAAASLTAVGAANSFLCAAETSADAASSAGKGKNKIALGINMEYVRSADKSFEWGVQKAGELGYEYVEPMVHFGRQMLCESGYFHSVSTLDDPLRIRRLCEKAGVKIGSISGHSLLCQPRKGAEYLIQAVRFAGECGATIVNTDEGPKAPWTTVEEDHVLMRYTLKEALDTAEPRGILIGLEMHEQYTKTPRRIRSHLQFGKIALAGRQLRHRQQLPGRRGPDRVASTRQRSFDPHPRQRHLEGPFRRGTRQGNRHPRRLRLRRWRDRLGQSH